MKTFTFLASLVFGFFAASTTATINIPADSIPELSDADTGRQVLKADVSEVSTMEELVTTEVRQDILNAFTINEFHRVNNVASFYYRTKQFAKAFPYLLASAKRGFKTSQYRLGVIYVNGLGKIKRDVALGIGWIGTAASPRSTVLMKETYQDLMDKVPERLRPKVQDVVDALIERYGSDATGVNCMNTRVAGTHMRSFQCNFDKEFEHRDAFFQDWLTTSFRGTSPYLTGMGSSDPTGQASPDAGPQPAPSPY
ncbi:MAG: hypothetical protein OXG24_08380 [Gammaproteobacteria bacterium]|nr:hypothetical protein [Gammaproteobacteria bacterium]